MTYPEGDVPPPMVTGDEKATLTAFLDYLRDRVIAKLDGITEEQARTPGVDSGTSLMGLVKHLTSAELNWIVWAFLAEADEQWEHSPALDDLDSIPGVIADYRAAAKRCDAAIAACPDLDTPAKRDVWDGENRPTLRWILLHTIEDTARHAGQADILRERVDGAIGR